MVIVLVGQNFYDVVLVKSCRHSKDTATAWFAMAKDATATFGQPYITTYVYVKKTN